MHMHEAELLRLHEKQEEEEGEELCGGRGGRRLEGGRKGAEIP